MTPMSGARDHRDIDVRTLAPEAVFTARVFTVLVFTVRVFTVLVFTALVFTAPGW